MQWQKISIQNLFIVTIVSFFSLAQAATPVGQEEGLTEALENPGYVEKPKWFKNSFLDMREDVAEATETGKRVVLYFFQDGCPYCKKLLEDNYGNREISEYSQKHFDTIAVNM